MYVSPTSESNYIKTERSNFLGLRHTIYIHFGLILKISSPYLILAHHAGLSSKAAFNGFCVVVFGLKYIARYNCCREVSSGLATEYVYLGWLTTCPVPCFASAPLGSATKSETQTAENAVKFTVAIGI